MQHYILEIHYHGRKAELALLHRNNPRYIEIFLQGDLCSLEIPREPAATVASFWQGDVPVVRCSWNAEHSTDDLEALYQVLEEFTPTMLATCTRRQQKALNATLRDLNIATLTVEFKNVSPAPEAPAAPARQPAPPKRPRSPVDGGHAEPQNKRPRQEASGAQPSAPGTRPTAMNTARTRPEGDNAPATGSRSAPADAAQPAGPARAAEASESGVTRSAARTVPLDTLNAASSRAVADDVVVKQEDADDAHALGGAAKENAPPGPQDAPGDQGERNRGATSIVGTLKTALDAAVAAADAHLNGLRSNVETRELETARLSKRLARQSAKLRATEQALQQREKDVEAAGARNDAALARAASEVSEARASESATAAQLAEARGQLAEARSQFVRGRLRLAEVTAERDRLAQLVATLQADIARDEAKHEAELKATQDMNALLRAQVGTLQSEAQAARTVASEELRQSELRVQAEIDKRQAAELKIQTEVERRQVAELSAQDLSKKYVRTQLDLLGEINFLREQAYSSSAAYMAMSQRMSLYGWRG